MKAIYGKDFYVTRHSRTAHFADRLSKLITDMFAPSSALDLGCGVGTVLQSLKKRGCSQILGIEGPWVNSADLLIDVDEFQYADLTRPLMLDRTFDVAISLEVAEHLDEHSSDTLIDSLCRLANKIVFSAAIPHQGGIDHKNEQWQSYWASKFVDRGFLPYDAIRPTIWSDKRIPFWYRQNSVIYLKESIVDHYPFLAQYGVNESELLNRVHPELYLQHQLRSRSTSYRQLLKKLPKEARKAGSRLLRRGR